MLIERYESYMLQQSAGCVFLRPYVVMMVTHSLHSNGVFQPYGKLGWWRWVYIAYPYTYLIEALVGQGVLDSLLSS